MPESDPSKKYWWIVGILVPLIVALIGLLHSENKHSGSKTDDAKQSITETKTTPSKPPCSAKLSSEHDDAQTAVHMYDNSITTNEARLSGEKNSLALAEANQDGFRVAEHRSLADTLESQIKSLKESRDEAARRVQEIEQQCAI